MYVVLQFSLFTVCVANTILTNPKNINLSLETVFEFDRKDKENDLLILDDIQNFINNVRQGLLKSSDDNNARKVKEKSKLIINSKARDNHPNGKSFVINLGTPFKHHKATSTNPTVTTAVAKRFKQIKTRPKQRMKPLNEIKNNNLEILTFKPLVNLFAMIIRSLDDKEVRSLIDVAHNETQKFKNRSIRRAMSEGLNVLKETPVDAIKEFLRKITVKYPEETTPSQASPNHKLNSAFDTFFSDLEWMLLQMDPDTASLLTVLFHNLEKVFVKELEKSKVKTLTDVDSASYHKLKRNPYIVESNEDGLVDIFKDSLKSLVFDNYANLNNKEKSWVRTKLKPLWENVRKFFVVTKERRNKTRKLSQKNNKGSWSVSRPKEKNVDSSVSIEDSTEPQPTSTDRNENEETHTKIKKTTTFASTINKTSKTTPREKVTKTTTSSETTKTTTLVTNVSSKSEPIDTLIEILSPKNKNQSSSDGGVFSDSADEIDKANRKFTGKRNASMQHRFRVLDSYNSTATVTRTTLKYLRKKTNTGKIRTTKSYTKDVKKKIRKKNYKVNKTTHIEFKLGLDSSSEFKPSRTTWKTTKLQGKSKLLSGKGKVMEESRRGRTVKFKKIEKPYLETIEEESIEDSDKNLQKIPHSLIKRIDHIEEKIENIEKIIHTEKTTTWLPINNGPKKNSAESDFRKTISTRTTKLRNSSRSTAASTILATNIRKKVGDEKSLEDNEVIDHSDRGNVITTTPKYTTSSLTRNTKLLSSTTTKLPSSTTTKLPSSTTLRTTITTATPKVTKEAEVINEPEKTTHVYGNITETVKVTGEWIIKV